MATWEIRWKAGERTEAPDLGAPVFVSAPDWMGALERGLESHGAHNEVLTRAVCLLRGDGSVQVSDPGSTTFFIIRQVESDEEPMEPPSLHGVAPAELGDAFDAPDPVQAGLSAGQLGPDEHAIGHLRTELSILSPSSDPSAVALAALDLLLRFVPAESASVLTLDPQSRQIRFLAARGPAAARLAGLSLPEGRGVAGLVIRSTTSLHLEEVRKSRDHFDTLDQRIGYHTRRMLACPLVRQGRGFGALEVINPFGDSRFSERHRQAAELTASQLSRLLA